VHLAPKPGHRGDFVEPALIGVPLRFEGVAIHAGPCSGAEPTGYNRGRVAPSGVKLAGGSAVARAPPFAAR
jgi:hypothetical protein